MSTQHVARLLSIIALWRVFPSQTLSSPSRCYGTSSRNLIQNLVDDVLRSDGQMSDLAYALHTRCLLASYIRMDAATEALNDVATADDIGIVTK
jgi:hypothetical protein